MANATQTAVAKIEALPSTDPSIINLKEHLEIIIKSFLENMLQLINQIQNVQTSEQYSAVESKGTER